MGQLPAKTFLKKISNLLLSSSFPLAVAGVLTLNAYQIGDHRYPLAYAGLVFGGILCIYNLHRLFKFYSGQYDSNSALKQQVFQHKWLHVSVMLIGVAISSWFGMGLLPEALVWLIVPTLIAVFYVMPIVGLPLREIQLMKGVFVAATWLYITSILPFFLFSTTQNFDWQIALFWLAIFLTFYIITGLSDIRDQHTDPQHLKTLPQVVGQIMASRVYFLLAVLSILIIAYCRYTHIIGFGQFLALCIGNLLMAYLALKSKNRQPHWFYSILVDGVLILQGLVYLIIKY